MGGNTPKSLAMLHVPIFFSKALGLIFGAEGAVRALACAGSKRGNMS